MFTSVVAWFSAVWLVAFAAYVLMLIRLRLESRGEQGKIAGCACIGAF